MKTANIISVVLATRSLDSTMVGLAAYLAKDGTRPTCTADVQLWWIKQGGTVDDPSPLIATHVES